MSDFEFLRYLHLVTFTAWVVAFVSLVIVVVYETIKQKRND
jgi:predicted MFS family arabinose efflux permease